MKRRLPPAVVVLVVTWSLLSTGTALACDTGRTLDLNVRKVLWIAQHGASSTTYVRAVKSTIDEDHPFIKDANGFSAAWAMVTITTANNDVFWAQVGWREDWGLFGHKLFWQAAWIDHTDGMVRFFVDRQGGDPSGSAQQWKVVWNNFPGSGNHTFYFYVDQVELDSNVEPWTPWDGHVGAEMYKSTSQAPGSVSNKVDMTGTQSHVNGSWVDYGTGIDFVDNDWNFDPWYGSQKLSDTSFRVWDRACP
jgi:hypothetical protein